MISDNWFATSCLLTLAALMGTALPAKLKNPYRVTAALVGYGVNRRLARFLSLPAILLELVVTVMLLAVRWPRLGGGLALGLLLLYTGLLMYSLLTGRAGGSCGCYAFNEDRPISWALVIRNGVAALIALVPILSPGMPGTALGWVYALTAALVWVCLLALIDELGTLFDLNAQRGEPS